MTVTKSSSVPSGNRLFCARIKGLHPNVKVKDIKQFYAPLSVKNVNVLKNGRGLVYFKDEETLSKALLKTGVLHKRQVRTTPWMDKLPKPSNCEKSEETRCTWQSKTKGEIQALILETGRLFIRNLSYTCSEDDLEKLFAKHGSISELHLCYDSGKESSKGFAFLTYMFPSDALKAFNALDKTKFMGRLLHILPGDEKTNDPSKPPRDAVESENVTDISLRTKFQDEKMQQLKASASVSHNWNALFIRPDAVATYIAAKFGVSKEELMDPSGRGSSAVRLAHGEVQLVAELRDYLVRNGVLLEAFTGPDEIGEEQEKTIVGKGGKRDKAEAHSAATHRQLSGTAFLIKNLPVGTTETEVRQLLKRFTLRCLRKQPSSANVEGDTQSQHVQPIRVLVPPLGITAIVEYAAPQQARLAYRALAYESFSDNVLLLQWVPEGALKQPESDIAHANIEKMSTQLGEKESKKGKKAKKRQRTSNNIKEESSDNGELLQDADEEFELVTSVRKRKKLSGSHEDTVDIAASRPKLAKKQLLKARQKAAESTTTSEEPIRADVEGEEEGGPRSQTTNTGPQPNRILMVRNVAFQATVGELTELFKPVGGLNNVRMPKKPTGGHRGFAFVEFNTLDQAKIALETFGLDTHFLGRRLRIEYARV